MSKFKIGDVWYDAATGKPVAEEGQPASADPGLQSRLEELQRELDEVRAAAARKAQDADRLVQQWQEQAKFHGDRATDLEAKLTNLTTENDSLKKQLADAKAIPADAVERLKGVDGIGDKMAQKALDALTAPAPKDGK